MAYILHAISTEVGTQHTSNIARDKGIYVSNILSLDSLPFNDINFLTDADGYFFDPYMSNRELDALINLISYYRENNIKKYFIFYIIDLHKDILDQWLTLPARIGRLAEASPSVGFFLAYSPKDCLKELLTIHAMNRCVALPHFYIPEAARDLDHTIRINKVLFCSPPKFGLDRPEDFVPFALRHDSVYPDRTFFEEHASPEYITTLPHPGYYNDDMTEVHCFDKFIDLISKYRFFFIEPSAFDLDLLKYSEVAEGGACPVGKLPTTFHGAPFISMRMDGSLNSQLQAITSMDSKQSQQIATEYRNYIDKQRNRHRFPEYMSHMIEALDYAWDNRQTKATSRREEGG